MSTLNEVDTGIPMWPFPGLRPFGHRDSAVFFGRDEQIDQLLCMLEDKRFLAVVGPSGCGKSSLVRAGMIPALEAGFMASAGFRWNTAVMRPGDRPIASLAKALVDSSIMETDPSDARVAMARLRATLRRGPLGLVEALEDTEIGQGQNLLLLIDQFEEVFRFEKQGGSNEARAFVDLLLASSEDRRAPVYVVITMRSDFLGNCPIFSGLPEAMNDSQFLTPRLTREQNRLAIECPVSLFDAGIDDDVVSRILNEMGTDPDQLPLMQHLLMRMWRSGLRRILQEDDLRGSTETVNRMNELHSQMADRPVVLTLEDYHQAGGLRRALSNHVQSIYERLTDEQRRITEMMFRRLTEVTSEGQVVRRFASIAEIAKAAAADENAVKQVVDEFRTEGRSFLMPPEADVPDLSSDTQIDITHESLIRQWELLSEWTEDEAQTSRIRQEMGNRAMDWDARQRDVDYLLTGLRLAEAQNWADTHPNELQQVEQEFLAESVASRDRAVKRKLRNYAVLGVVSIAIAIMSFGLFLRANSERLRASNESKKAMMETRKARAHELAAEAKIRKFESPQLGLILAVEAVEATESGEPVVDRARDILSELLSTPQSEEVLQGHEGDINELAISSDEKWLVTSSSDTTARLWDLESLDATSNPIILPNKNRRVRGVAFSPDNQWLFASSDDGNVRIWNLQMLEDLKPGDDFLPIITVNAKSESRVVAVSRNGKFLAAGTEQGDAYLWDLTRLPIVKNPEVLRGHRGPVRAMAFSPDDKWLVTGSNDNSARLWSLNVGVVAQSSIELVGHRDSVSSLAIDKNSKYLVTGSYDKTARRWDLTKFDRFAPATQSASSNKSQAVHPFGDQHTDRIHSVVISPDSKWVATASKDQTIKLARLDFETKNGEVHADLKGHSNEVLVVDFCPSFDEAKSDLVLVSGSLDNTARIWEVSRDSDIAPRVTVLEGHQNRVSCLANSKHRIYTGSFDSNVRVWDRNVIEIWRSIKQREASFDNASVDELVGFAGELATRNLAIAEFQTHFSDSEFYHKTFENKEIHRSVFGPAKQLVLDGNAAEAISQLEEIYQLESDEADPKSRAEAFLANEYRKQAQVSARRGEIEDAIRLFDSARALGHEQNLASETEARRLASESFEKQGRRWLIKKQSKRAKICFEQALEYGSNVDPQKEINQWLDRTSEVAGESRQKKGFASGLIKTMTSATAMFQEGHRLAKKGDINGAQKNFKIARKLDPSLHFNTLAFARKIAGADRSISILVGEARIQEALALYQYALLDPTVNISPITMNQLAYHGALAGYASEIAESGIADRMVELDPSHRGRRDTRGLVRALGTDDIAGAIEDFKAFGDWEGIPDSIKQKRYDWVERLQKSKDSEAVFTHEVREELRQNETTDGFFENWKKAEIMAAASPF